MSTIVIGASGFVGRHVCAALARDGAPFVGLSRRAPEPFIAADLLTDRVDFTPYTAAVWCAGNSDHGLSERDPARDLAANALTLLNLLATFRGHLTLVSTGAVYDPASGEVDTEAPQQPQIPYGISKTAAEDYARSAFARGQLASLVILRLFHPFGDGERPTRFFPAALSCFALGRSARFTIRGTGQSLFDALPVEVVASAIAAAHGKQVRGEIESATLDICHGEPLTVEQWALGLKRHFGSDAEVVSEGDETFPVRFFSRPDAAERTLEVPLAVDPYPYLDQYADILRSRAAEN